jgi:hypothetical protein
MGLWPPKSVRSIVPDESKITFLMNDREYELALLEAEYLLKEWDLIYQIFPKLIEKDIIYIEEYQKPEDLMIDLLKRRSFRKIQNRSLPYYEVSRAENSKVWEDIYRLTKEARRQRKKSSHLVEDENLVEDLDEDLVEDLDEDLKSLFSRRNVEKDSLYKGLILGASLYSSENPEIQRLLEDLGKLHEDLADEAADDWDVRTARGYKHNSEIWKNGDRYIVVKGNRLERAPYDHEFVRFLYSDNLIRAMNGELDALPDSYRAELPY